MAIAIYQMYRLNACVDDCTCIVFPNDFCMVTSPKFSDLEIRKLIGYTHNDIDTNNLSRFHVDRDLLTKAFT